MHTQSFAPLLFMFGEIYAAILIMSDDIDMVDLHWRRLIVLGAVPSLGFGVSGWRFP